MSPQQAFDTVVSHLRKQGHKSLLENPIPILGKGTICAYRGKDGDKCAAGILILDADYQTKMEGISWNDVVGWLSNASELREHTDLILNLQGIHDVYEPDHWEDAFMGIASIHSLIYTPPQLVGG